MPRQSKTRRRGTIAPRGDGRWIVRLSLGSDPHTGHRARVNRIVAGTKRDAEAVLTDLLGRSDKGGVLPTGKRTLAEWLEEYGATWSGHLSVRTREQAAAALATYLPEPLRGVQLRHLTPRLFQDVYNEMVGRGLAPATVSILHRVLRSRMNKAVELGYLGQNPLHRVKPPRVPRRAYRILQPDEARIFLEEAESDRYGTLWALLLLTGLRPEEALALTWSDIDGAAVRVRRALVRGREGAFDFAATKTGTGRSVKLSTIAARVLKGHRARQAELRLLMGQDYEDRGLVFCSEFGRPLFWNTVVTRSFRPILGRVALRLAGETVTPPQPKGMTRRAFRAAWVDYRARVRAALEQTGLHQTRPYDLRHSAASLLLAAGEHPKVVSEMLGHSKITLTLDTYSHVIPGLQERAAEKLEDVIMGRQAVAVNR